MNSALIILLVTCIVIIAFIALYNKLTTKRNQIQNAISSLDALFIKRADLIPNLISFVKQYMAFEKDTLEKITQLRVNTPNSTQYLNDSEGTSLMKQLMLTIENYPELKADSQFTQLQYSFNECEEQIAAGRRFLSTSITIYNNQVTTFPSNIVALVFGYKQHQWENANDDQKKSINAQELFNS